MKCFWALLFPIFLCTGCLVTEEETMSAIEYSRLEDAQLHHYRPVHRNNPNWMIAGSGKTMTIHAGNDRVKLSVRRNPDRIVIRKNGAVIGQLETTEHGAKYKSFNNAEKTFDIHCIVSAAPSQGDSAVTKVELKNDKETSIYRMDGQDVAEDNQYEVRKLNYNNRYSISLVKNSKLYAESCHGSGNNKTCQGTELESPFSAVGTLIFHSDSLPLELRSAAAWLLTRKMMKCDE
ncbi:MAG: hypothetical protein J6A01_09575 [Proteobacteria bacterium]|nr:hypothetical protein [Pseudomonadota bacterium]